MNKERAQLILSMIERINQEIDLLGKLILRNKLKPIPIPTKDNNRFGIK